MGMGHYSRHSKPAEAIMLAVPPLFNLCKTTVIGFRTAANHHPSSPLMKPSIGSMPTGMLCPMIHI